MEPSYRCDPGRNFRHNFENAMFQVLSRYEMVYRHEIARGLNSVRDDLNRMAKHKPVRKHRLEGAEKDIYDMVVGVCRWYLDEGDPDANDPLNRPQETISVWGLFRRLGSLRGDAESASWAPPFSYAESLREKHGGREPAAAL